jgi:broad specificity phosphatase PhoE
MAVNLYLIRHAQSEANVDRTVKARMSDHLIPLTNEGQAQGVAAGKALRAFLEEEHSTIPPLQVWRSSYKRTRQTSDLILSQFGEAIHSVDESDLLREQEFGLFGGYFPTDLMTMFPTEYSHYKARVDNDGEFFARVPQGESWADVSLRVQVFFGMLLRELDRKGPITGQDDHHVVIVSHGVTIRCMIKEWQRLPYEWINKEPTPGNCSIRVIRGYIDEGYVFPGFRRSGSPKSG